jgi:hypothetical protein
MTDPPRVPSVRDTSTACVKVTYVGGQLRLDGHCSERELNGVDAHCGISYLLEVPGNLPVHVVTGLGDVHAEHLDDDTDLETSTGDVHVETDR